MNKETHKTHEKAHEIIIKTQRGGMYQPLYATTNPHIRHSFTPELDRNNPTIQAETIIQCRKVTALLLEQKLVTFFTTNTLRC